MTTRLITAYAMIAAMAGAGLFCLWLFVLREKWARRGRRNLARRERLRAGPPIPDTARPVPATD